MRIAPRNRTALLAALVTCAVAPGRAQTAGRVALTVRETAGMRRTEFPVSARVALPRGAATDVAHLRLVADGAELAGQFTAGPAGPDGSLQAVDVDFNLTIGAGESRTIVLEYGAGVSAAGPPRGGLSVAEDGDRVRIGAVALGARGWPLLASVAYRGEIIAPGANGLSVVDASGARHEFGSATGVTAEVIKRGPLLAVVRYTGRVPLGGGSEVPVTLTCELPNSKSWIKVSATVEDRGRLVRGFVFETPFALGPFPWTWDFGTDGATYGAFRTAADAAVLTQSGGRPASAWRVETGTSADRRVYEQSVPGRAAAVQGWGHLLDARNAVAFAVEGFATAPGSSTLSLDGAGHATFAVARAPALSHTLTVFEHFVSTPVPIGAATSPAAMLRPLVVSVAR